MPKRKSEIQSPPRRFPLATIERHEGRVRRVCLAFAEVTEKPSHGEATFFVGKRVFAMMSTDHHDDGRLAVVIPLAEGVQEELLERDPTMYYFPPYVGVRGWIGIDLITITDVSLRRHLGDAWRLIAPKRLTKAHVEQ